MKLSEEIKEFTNDNSDNYFVVKMLNFEWLSEIEKLEKENEEIANMLKAIMASRTGKINEYIRIKADAIKLLEKYYNKSWKEINNA